jgi:hypothetical protein
MCTFLVGNVSLSPTRRTLLVLQFSIASLIKYLIVSASSRPCAGKKSPLNIAENETSLVETPIVFL